MPDPTLILTAMAAAAAIAAAFVLAFAWPWREPNATRVALGWILGIGSAFFVGSYLLGVHPKTSLDEVTDRLFLILVPAAIATEILAIFATRFAWLLRVGLAGSLIPVLLHGTNYIADTPGPVSLEGPTVTPSLWTTTQTAMIAGGIALAVVGSMVLAAIAHKRSASRILPAALALTSAATGVTLMLSGYATAGGQVGLPLGAALIAAALASWTYRAGVPFGAIALGILFQAASLIAGRFFVALTTENALLLFSATVVCWLALLLPVSKAWVRASFATVTTAALAAFAVSRGIEQFRVNSAPAAAETLAPAGGLSDYTNFGK